MREILILKVGAFGDVIRTTPILHRFKEDNVTWITSEKAKALLKNNNYINELLAIESLPPSIYQKNYDIALNMDEDKPCLVLASDLIKKNKIKKFYGYFINEQGTVDYVGESFDWFDMSLNSKLGLEEANKLKWENKKSYEEHLFSILGFKFNGEKPILNYSMPKKAKLVGIQNLSMRDTKWPMKRWNNYEELKDKLISLGYEVRSLELRPELESHIKDIAECSLVICEDSLPMQIALALNKLTIATFICTPPQEIYGYGILTKVISPELQKYWYRRDYDPNAANTIKLKDILKAFENVVNNNLGI